MTIEYYLGLYIHVQSNDKSNDYVWYYSKNVITNKKYNVVINKKYDVVTNLLLKESNGNTALRITRYFPTLLVSYERKYWNMMYNMLKYNIYIRVYIKDI